MIRNILFDLGNVLYALDFKRTEDAFRAMQNSAGSAPRLDYHFSGEAPTIFDRFETGDISSEEFRSGLRKQFALHGDDAVLDAAWNALLVSPILENVTLLPRLQGRYRLFLLSNTNSIHIAHVGQVCPALLESFESLFLSHEIRFRKPGPEIFRHALTAGGLEPSETLFIDDAIRNVEGAARMGLTARHLKVPTELEEMLRGELGDL